MIISFDLTGIICLVILPPIIIYLCRAAWELGRVTKTWINNKYLRKLIEEKIILSGVKDIFEGAYILLPQMERGTDDAEEEDGDDSHSQYISELRLLIDEGMQAGLHPPTPKIKPEITSLDGTSVKFNLDASCVKREGNMIISRPAPDDTRWRHCYIGGEMTSV